MKKGLDERIVIRSASRSSRTTRSQSPGPKENVIQFRIDELAIVV
jgi:hypothetical protein